MIIPVQASSQAELFAPSPRNVQAHAQHAHAVIMKVGPHSGMTLSEIVASKMEEEQMHGVHYWGYSGTLCQPARVLAHVEDALLYTREAPELLLIETASSYSSSIGTVSRYSTDGVSFQPFKHPVQLQGAEFAIVARSLRLCNEDVPMDAYRVAQSNKSGRPLSQYLRGRVGKACAIRAGNPHPDLPLMRIAYRAKLAPPFAIWLAAGDRT